MIFKKIFLLVFFLGIIVPGMPAAEKWADKDAEYRISFTLPKKGAPGFWKVNNYALPFELSDGFTVWDEAGKKYHFFFNFRKRELILAAPETDNKKVYVYPSKMALARILDKRRYYIRNRFIRDWHWWIDQPVSQAVNIMLLSYEPDQAAIKRAKIIKARAEKRAKAIAAKKAAAKAKALARAKAIAKRKAAAKARAIAKSKAMNKALTETQAELEKKNIAEALLEAKKLAKLESVVKPKAKTMDEQAIEKALAEAKAELDKKPVEKKTVKKAVKPEAAKKIVKKKVVKKKVVKKKPKKKIRRRPKRLPRIGHLPGKDFPADTADLRKIFKYKIQQYIYRRNYRDTNIIRNIHWRLKGRYVAYIDAKLNIPKPGKYQFAVKSNDMTQLYINGGKALNIDKKTASTGKWRETKVFDLSGSQVKVEAYYRSSVDKTSIVIGWRAEGEKDYKFITQNDYINSNKIEPQTLASNKGQKLPVIKYNTIGYFQNRNEKQFLLGFETDYPGDKLTWMIDGESVASGNKIQLTFANEMPDNIACAVNGSKPFRLIIPKAGMKNPGELMKRDLYVKINAPVFIYDDENLDLYAEFHSEQQIDIKAFLEAKSNSDIFETFKISHDFNKTSNEPMFRKHDFVKKYFKLEGAKLKNGTELEFSIETFTDDTIPEDEKFYFNRKKVIFKKLAQYSDLKTEDGHFVDSEGNRVIPILHRPTLKDKRSWSFLNTLPAVLGKQTDLIISDDFGDKRKFSDELLENAGVVKQKLIFEGWNLQAHDADIVHECAGKIKLIRQSKADVLIIIPSAYPIIRGVSPRLQQRLLAAMIQTARDNGSIKKIILTTPFPLPEPFSGNETADMLLKGIQDLVTEQEIGFVSLPEFPEDEETVISSIHPAARTKEYADILVK